MLKSFLNVFNKENNAPGGKSDIPEKAAEISLESKEISDSLIDSKKTTPSAVMPEYSDAETLDVYRIICHDLADVYIINKRTRKVVPFRYSGKAAGLDDIVNGGNFEDAIEAFITNNVHPLDRDMFRKLSGLDTVCEQLQTKAAVNIYFRAVMRGKLKYFKLSCIRNGEPEKFEDVVYAFVPEGIDVSRMQTLHLIEMDELTGIYTKQAFMQYARKLIDKDLTTAYCIIISDIENFKLINSIYGESEGNTLIKYLAEKLALIKGCKLIGRYGGDQFVMLFKAATEDTRRDFANSIERIREEAPISYVSIKYGINERIDPTDSVNFMCDKCLVALRTIKHISDQTIASYDDEIASVEKREQLFEARFEAALNRGEFVVWYQPKYSCLRQTIVGAEALVRWKNADGSLISPGEFIPVFEADGLIVSLDEFVFRTVCERQKAMLDSGIEPAPVSVNMSRTSLFQQNVVSKYKTIIEDLGLDKKYVPIEITESAALETTKIQSFANEIKEAGFKLLLDDFGTGYSSLSSLSMLPFDVVKLDKSLIDNIGNVSGDEILKHIVELSHFLKMEVVAEGVENEDQLKFLKKLGCDTIQGFLLGKPEEYDSYLELYKKNRESLALLNDDDDELAEDSSIGSLRLTNDVRMQYLQAMSGIYMTIHVIDLNDDSVVEFATTTNVKKAVNKVKGAAPQMHGAMRATVNPAYLDAALEFTDLTTIRERLQGRRSISEDFGGIHFEWFRAQFICISTDENDVPEKIMFTTQVVQHTAAKEEKEAPQDCKTDILTGVRNRDSYDEDLMAFDDPRNKEFVVTEDTAVIMLDINGLNDVNSKLGRIAGDELICGAAGIFTTAVAACGTVYRVGGDDFAAIVKADDAQLANILRKIATRSASWMGDNVRSIDLSYSSASAREFPGANLDKLTREADKKLYRKKINI